VQNAVWVEQLALDLQLATASAFTERGELQADKFAEGVEPLGHGREILRHLNPLAMSHNDAAAPHGARAWPAAVAADTNMISSGLSV
jgi:hypothetical protein